MVDASRGRARDREVSRHLAVPSATRRRTAPLAVTCVGAVALAGAAVLTGLVIEVALVLLVALLLAGPVMLAVGVLLLRRRRRVSRQPRGRTCPAGPELLSDLRQRLDIQAQVPTLGEGFHVETCVVPAQGQAFSGDFSVAVRRGNRFELALTDVSGHGQAAGARALLLSGALSGLLGEVSAECFLPAANRYLVRQGWRDGFASCIHVVLDLETGRFDIGTAGHPSAAHFHARARRWEMVSGASGLLLGLFDVGSDDYARASGVLEPGDVLLLYTDGLVESGSGDLLTGTDRMLQHAEDAVADGPAGAARRICAAVAAAGDDDRSAVLLWRSASAGDR